MPVLVRVLVVLAVVLAIVVGFWAVRTLTIQSPYDEVWIGLNSAMPSPMRAWACGEVRARNPGAALPPLGCEGLWR